MKKRIAIIGGGTGSLMAAFGITEKPDWQDEYEITVYQLGWRLGGKGASGRQLDENARILEHGLHVWGGFYENAFRVIRSCYDEMARPAGAPLRDVFFGAFTPQSCITWEEQLDGEWLDWVNRFPEELGGSLPGDGEPFPSTWKSLVRIMEWLANQIIGSGAHVAASAKARPVAETPDWLSNELNKVSHEVKKLVDQTYEGLSGLVSRVSGFGVVQEFLHHLHSLSDDHQQNTAAQHHGLIWLLERMVNWFLAEIEHLLDANNQLRRLAILVELGFVHTKGLIESGALFHGFDSLDDWDWRDWLKSYGASERVLQCAIVRGAYDFIFAYRGGDSRQPSCACGVMIRCLMRLVMWYKGAIFFKMNAGMGDTVFAPLYFALKKRGVKFKFFHNVKSLQLSEDNRSVESMTVGVQATVKSGDYDPLVTVKDLPCWPSTPNFDQLDQGDQLRDQGIDLESYWTPWTDVDEVTLRCGTDFDLVVLGVPPSSQKIMCSDLMARNDRYAEMVNALPTVATQALQLWLTPNLEQLGWKHGATIMTAYADPEQTWADMSQVIPRESWASDPPGNIAYFCGPLEQPEDPPPPTEHDYPARMFSRVRELNLRYFNTQTAHLWPDVASRTHPGGIDPSVLVADSGSEGEARFDAQYWRANVTPTERYVLSLPKTTAKRLQAGKSGFENLFLAGDWVLNGLNFGCIESATMGGLQASRAICGYPTVIAGEGDG